MTSSWAAPLGRAVPAVVLAAAVTFSANHSVVFGSMAFGLFAITSGAVIGVFAWRAAPGRARGFQLAQAVLSCFAGLAALSVIGGDLFRLIFLISGWAAITGLLELYLGVSVRAQLPPARDWVFIGSLTTLAAIVVALVPSGFSQSFTGPDGVQRELTGSVIVVGVLGAYGAILGVFLVIAALSMKWATIAPAETRV